MVVNDWQVPAPLFNANAVPYPTTLLPDIIRNAVEEYKNYGQQPLSIIACSALANVSLVCQGLANIARDEHLISPLSLYFIIVAESGERKTAVDKVFSDCAKQWEQIKRDDLKDNIKRNQAERDAWYAQREGILATIKTPKHKGENIESLKYQLQQLDLREPKKIILPNLYHEETNAESLAYNLASGWQSSSLWSDEAGIVVGGHGMNQDNITKFITLLNRLWDGNSYRVNRKTTDSFVVEGRRLTCSLMMQPAVFDQLLNRCGNISRDSGFLARCLVVRPPSTMGTRYYQPLSPDMPNMRAFCDRIKSLLALPLVTDERQRLNLPLLKLSQAAKDVWIQFHDEVEKQLSIDGEFNNIKDFAAKAAENAARLAGNFHIFGNENGQVVDFDNMQRAIQLMDWHLKETKRLNLSTEYQDAQLLLNWLKDKQYREIKINDVLRLAHPTLRIKERRNKAIQVLQEHRYLIMTAKDNKQHLILNPYVWEEIQNETQ